MPDKPEQLSYELRIGVTGHRNLSNESAVAEAVNDLIAYLDKLIGKQDNISIEWSIISPLAKGADTIVARSFLAKPDARLEVFLPFPLEEYRQMLTDPDELDDFNKLFKRASLYFEPSQDSKGYLQVGKEVVNTCELLITIWDGKGANGEGGTAEIVKYALESGRTIIRIDSENPKAAPSLLVTKKNKDKQDNTPQYLTLPLPDTTSKLLVKYHQIIELSHNRHFLEFCLDKSLATTEQDRLTEKCWQDVKVLAKKVELPEKQLEPILEYLMPMYVRSDQLATHYQKLHLPASKAIHILAAMAVFIVVLQLIFFPDPNYLWIISLEIGSMFGVLIALYISRKYRWHEKWIDYRYLAEQLRTAIHTAVVLNKNPLSESTPTPKTLPFYNPPKSWIEILIANQSKMTLNRLGTPADFNATKQFVIRGWLNNQQEWHEKTSKKKEQIEMFLRKTVFMLFCITLLMACLHLSKFEFLEKLHFEKWGTFLAITLPALGAAIHAITKQLEYDRIAERSKKMAAELGRLVERAEKSTSMEELREIVQQAIQTVNLETFEWWALISFNSPELVA
jgi:hypothetical protein